MRFGEDLLRRLHLRIGRQLPGAQGFQALLVLVLAGLLVALKMPVALFPDITFPRIVVSADSGNMPIGQTHVAVTRPLEQALRAVPGTDRRKRDGAARRRPL